MKISKRFAATAAVGLLALPAAGCKSSASDDGGLEVIKIGLAMPLTGPLSTNATDLIRYAEYGVEDANKELEADGIKLELVPEDTAGTAEQGVTALNRLASVERTPIVLTAYSSVVNAIAPLAEDLDVALVNIGAQAPTLATVSPNLVNFYPLATVHTKAMATYLLDNGITKAGVVYVDAEGGIAPAESFEEEYTEAGGTIVGMEPVRPGAPDASVPVAKLLDQDPEAVFMWTTQPETPPVMQALRSAGGDFMIATHSGIAEDTAAREATGDRMTGVMYSTLVPEDSPELQAVIDRFSEEEGREPSLLSLMPYEYDFGFLVGEAVKAVQESGEDIDGSSLIEAFHEVGTFQTPTLGETVFSEQLTITAPITVKEIVDATQPNSNDEIITTVETSD